MIHVLLVEDDPEIARTIRYYLSQEEIYDVTWAKTGTEAQALMSDSFDIVLMDIMLPDGNGIDFCAGLREERKCPLIFISCIDDTDTIVKALSKGGDDYITKPFDNRVLHARIQANLRRVRLDHQAGGDERFSCGRFVLDVKERTVCLGGEQIPLSRMECRLLAYMMKNEGTYFKSGELYRMLWGGPSYGDNRTVVVHIHNLRKKIEENYLEPRYLVNVRGRGYAFVRPPEDGS